MLVLSRRPRERIIIGDLVKVAIYKIKGNRVWLAIEAPDHIGVAREEIWGGNTPTQEEEQAAWSPS